MNPQWYFSRGDAQEGPVSEEQLKEHLASLSTDDNRVLVWREGMNEWADPRSIPGLLQVTQTPSAPAAGLEPYQAPASSLAESSQLAVESGNFPLEIGTCATVGWNLTLAHFGKLILFGLCYIGIAIVASLPLAFLQSYLIPDANAQPTVGQTFLQLGFQLIQNAISLFFGIGVAIFGLGIIKRTNPNIGELFSGGRYFWQVLGATILYTLAVIIGLVCLIIPGIIIAIRLGQYQFAIVDQNLGPIEGLKSSWNMTQGNTLNLIGFFIVIIGIFLLGLLAFGIGLLWAYPTIFLAGVAAYQNMQRGAACLPQFPK